MRRTTTHPAQPSMRQTGHWRLSLLGMAVAALGLIGCAPERLAPPPASGPIIEIQVAAAGQSGGSSRATASQFSEIRARVPFAFETPTWVPDGFYPSNAIGLASDASWVLLGWEHDAGNRIDLIISPQAPELPEGPPTWVRSTSVNGQPGVLILGVCRKGEAGWDPTLQTILAWEAGEVHYALASTGTTATAYDLQRMAESMN